jgi:chromosome segregation ATPase
MAKKYTEAFRFLSQLRDDRRNWNSGMDHIEELFQLAEKAAKDVDASEKQLANAQAALAEVARERSGLEDGLVSLREQFDQAKSDLHERQDDAAKVIADLDAQIAARREKLSVLENAINESGRDTRRDDRQRISLTVHSAN